MKLTEIRIQRTPKFIGDQYHTIAQNDIQHTCEFIRPLIKQIVNEFPDELKTEQENSETMELRIGGISQELKDELKLIAKNLGVSETQLLKVKLYEKLQEVPAYLK